MLMPKCQASERTEMHTRELSRQRPFELTTCGFNAALKSYAALQSCRQAQASLVSCISLGSLPSSHHAKMVELVSRLSETGHQAPPASITVSAQRVYWQQTQQPVI